MIIPDINLTDLQYALEEKSTEFERGLLSFLQGSSSSSWKVIFLAVWSGAQSKKLDECIAIAQEKFYAELKRQQSDLVSRMGYRRRSQDRSIAYSTKQKIALSVAPWVPVENVSPVDLLEGNPTWRPQVADLLDQLDEDVAYEYFCIWRELERSYPLRHELTDRARRQLLDYGLIRECDKNDVFKFVRWLTFSGLKAFMTEHNLPVPRGFDAGVARIHQAGDLTVAKLESLILQVVNPEDYFLLLPPTGLTRTSIMDTRVRAQVLVSLLVSKSQSDEEWNECID